MTARIRTIQERGKFFIETGTAKTFNRFLSCSAHKIIKYVPESVLKRIEDLIKAGDIDSAVALWMKACEMADNEPFRRRKLLFFYISYTLFAVMAVIAFLRTL